MYCTESSSIRRPKINVESRTDKGHRIATKWHSKEVNNCRECGKTCADFLKTDYDEWNLLIDLLHIEIKEVNQPKDICILYVVMISVLCTRSEFVASVFRIYYACQTDAQRDTRVCFCFLPPNSYPRTHNILDTKMCANYANLRQVRQVNWKLKTNCKFAYRSIVARFLRRTRCKYQKIKTKTKPEISDSTSSYCYKKYEIQYNRQYRYRKSIVNSANDFFIFFKYLFTHFQCQLTWLPRRVA